jgi:hypothetical protein
MSPDSRVCVRVCIFFTFGHLYAPLSSSRTSFFPGLTTWFAAFRTVSGSVVRGAHRTMTEGEMIFSIPSTGPMAGEFQRVGVCGCVCAPSRLGLAFLWQVVTYPLATHPSTLFPSTSKDIAILLHLWSCMSTACVSNDAAVTPSTGCVDAFDVPFNESRRGYLVEDCVG